MSYPLFPKMGLVKQAESGNIASYILRMLLGEEKFKKWVKGDARKIRKIHPDTLKEMFLHEIGKDKIDEFQRKIRELEFEKRLLNEALEKARDKIVRRRQIKNSPAFKSVMRGVEKQLSPPKEISSAGGKGIDPLLETYLWEDFLNLRESYKNILSEKERLEKNLAKRNQFWEKTLQDMMLQKERGIQQAKQLGEAKAKELSAIINKVTSEKENLAKQLKDILAEKENLAKELAQYNTLERNMAAHIMEKLFGREQLRNWGLQAQMWKAPPEKLKDTLTDMLAGEKLKEFQKRVNKWKGITKEFYNESFLNALKRIGMREWKYGGLGGKAKIIGGLLGGLGALGGAYRLGSLFGGNGKTEIKTPQSKQPNFWDYITNKFSEIF